MNKVVIIGCGNVGMSYAYALLNQRTPVQELVLIDINEEKTIGEVMDLNHCLSFAPSHIRISYGRYEDCRNASLVCICAGANQKVGETRTDLLRKNAILFKAIVQSTIESGFEGIFLVATNPMDAMTYLTWKYSRFPKERVIGSGTCLDTARLRFLIGDHLHINPKNVHAYMIGEHGDSEFSPFESASVGLEKISSYLSKEELNHIYVQVRDSAYEIIRRKGATYYGIGMCLVRITNAILGDENAILTVSSYDSAYELYNGYPTLLNKNGVVKRMPLSLSLEEQQAWEKTNRILKENVETCDQILGEMGLL